MRSAQRGFSIGELLAVLAIIGVLVGVSVPLVGETLRRAAIRQSADQFTVDLRAARMIAVSRRQPVNFVITEEPANSYRYTRADGLQRVIRLPQAVRILTASTPETITFNPDGSVAAPATTVIEVDLTGSVRERWTVTTNVSGIPSVTKQRVSS